MLKAHFGLHASLTVSDERLKKCIAENNGRVGFHSHAAEGIVDQEDSLTKYGKRVVERFADAGYWARIQFWRTVCTSLLTRSTYWRRAAPGSPISHGLT
jgi:cytosine/adenosine deaminase-related metal-dependent hydrolase